jgi:hypothetical protein
MQKDLEKTSEMMGSTAAATGEKNGPLSSSLIMDSKASKKQEGTLN